MQTKLSTLIALAALIFAGTLAVIIGQRLSTEAMAVLLGVFAGVIASVPTTAVVTWLVLRNNQPTQTVRVERTIHTPAPVEQAPYHSMLPAPYTMPPGLMPNGQNNPFAGTPYQNIPYQGLPNTREFTVIGGDPISE